MYSNRVENVDRGERDLNRILTILIAAIGLLQFPPGHAQHGAGAPGPVDARTLRVQQKAEELFERGDYGRAHFIYRNELAPIGDKYAQYMLGFMSLTGLGVSEDPIAASAWYRLAAERDAPEFIAVRDELIRRLDTIDMERSDTLYLRLRQEYSDIVVRMRLVRKDFELLEQGSLGSRTGRTMSPVTIVRPGGGAGQSADAYTRDIHRRMQKHLDYIVGVLGIEPMDSYLTEQEVEDLEGLVTSFVSEVDDR